MQNLNSDDLFKLAESTDVSVWREAAERETDKSKRELLFSMYNYTMAQKQEKVISEPGFTI